MAQNTSCSPQKSNITSVEDIIQKCSGAGQLEITQIKRMMQVVASNLKQLICNQNEQKQQSYNTASKYIEQFVDLFAEKISIVHEGLEKVITAVQKQMHDKTDSINRQITQMKQQLKISNQNLRINISQQQQHLPIIKKLDSMESQCSNRSENIDRGVEHFQQTKGQLTSKISSIMDKLYSQKKIYFEQIAVQKARQVQRLIYQKIDLVWKDIVELYKKQRILAQRMTKISNVVSLFTVISDENFYSNPIQSGGMRKNTNILYR